MALKNQVKITIDNQEVFVDEGITVLEAAKQAGIRIPTLCYYPGLSISGACRICVVEIEGRGDLVTACSYPVSDGMVIHTNTYKIRRARKTVVELLVANHPQECLICVRSGTCELQSLAQEYGLREFRWTGEKRHYEPDTSTTSIIRQPDKCVLCGRCVKMCKEVQEVYAIDFTKRGFQTLVGPAFDMPLAETVCVLCGQCLLVCPTAAIRDQSSIQPVRDRIDKQDKICVVQVAPSIRVSIGEEFGLEPGTIVTGKLVSALRRLGFKYVFDTDLGADITVIEEGHEFIKRLAAGGPFPLITSCSPGWVKYMEHFYPEFIPNMSTCKSPQQMLGVLTKTYFADKLGVKPEDIFSVSIMPCSAKKFEIQRPEQALEAGVLPVDAVLTTRELARMLKIYGIDLPTLSESEFDAPLGIASGAGLMFGATGGVMEAALRTVSEVLTGKALQKIEFSVVRGYGGIKEGSVIIGDKEIRVAAAHGLGNVRRLLDRIKAGEEFHFVEVMACPGGCIGGGGQPIPSTEEIRKKRIAAIYEADRGLPVRKSHENPAVKEIYDTFLGEPNSEKSHRLLHTHYEAREPRGV